MVLMKKPLPMLTGEPGPQPQTDRFCLSYASHSVNQEMKSSARAELEVPTVWVTKASTIYKVEFCDMTNRWFWTPVAKCSCTKNTCGRGPKRAHSGKGKEQWQQQGMAGKGKGSGKGSKSRPSY